MSKQPPSSSPTEGALPLWRMSKSSISPQRKIVPDSFVFCIILTFLVFVLSPSPVRQKPAGASGGVVGTA